MASNDKFKRQNGFLFTAIRGFIDSNFVKCPMCGTLEPNWLTDTPNFGYYDRIHYMCDKCGAILSCSTHTISLNRGLITNLVRFGGSMFGKKILQTKFTIDHSGDNPDSKIHQGKIYTAEELRSL